MRGGVELSLMSCFGDPATIAWIWGSGSLRTSELSSSAGVNRTLTNSSCGSLALTTSHKTIARNIAVPLSTRRSVNAATMRRWSELCGRAAGTPVTRPSAGRGRGSFQIDRARRVATRAGARRRQSEQLRDQRPVSLRVPVIGPDPLLANRPFTTDDERLGISGRLKDPLDRVRRIVQDLERDPVCLCERADRVFAHVVVDAHRDELEPLRAVLLVQ